jgi:ABC-2 type transport system ATP-binding protein
MASSTTDPTEAAPRDSSPSEHAVEVRDVTKTYRQGIFRPRVVNALRGVSLVVPRGEIFGLLGPNGAGKTTLIKILLGIVKKSTGTASVLGFAEGSRAARSRVGYLPENNRIPRHHNASSALEYFGGLSGLSPRQVFERRKPLLEMVGLKGWEKMPVKQFSKGMQQRLGLAQALLHNPELLILDEPTDGVDPVGRAELRDVLLKLRASGKTIFLNSHHLQEMELVCDRVVIMNKGRVLSAGHLDDLTARPSLRLSLANQLDHAQEILKKHFRSENFIDELHGQNTWSLSVPELEQNQLDQLIDELRKANVSVIEVIRERHTLEETFLKVIEAATSENPPTA